jgi:hypothetical protein
MIEGRTLKERVKQLSFKRFSLTAKAWSWLFLSLRRELSQLNRQRGRKQGKHALTTELTQLNTSSQHINLPTQLTQYEADSEPS